MKQPINKPLDLGQFPKRLRTPPLADAAEWFAAALALVWVLAVLAYGMTAPDLGSFGVLLLLVSLFLPLILILSLIHI
jgi:hypothetical protein